MVVKNADKPEDLSSDDNQTGGDKKMAKPRHELDADESVISLSELLEAESKEEEAIRYLVLFCLPVCFVPVLEAYGKNQSNCIIFS